jgi:hypothetical protein
MISTASIFQSPSTQDPSTTFAITAAFPGLGNILNVTSTAATIVAGQVVSGTGMPYGAAFLPYGTGGTTGTGSTGTYVLSVYGQPVASEPMTVTLSPYGQAGVGSIWYQTDTNLIYVRNTANNGWTLIGSVNTTNFGMLPRAGGALSSAITGSTGLLTEDGLTPFVYPPYVTSKLSLIATLADLANIQVSLDAQIATSVAQQISSIGLPSLTSNMLVVTGTIGNTSTYTGTPANFSVPIAGLTYANGKAVQLTDCHCMASLQTVTFDGHETSIILQPQDNRGMTWLAVVPVSGELFTGYYCTVNYLLIAINPTA